MPSAVGRYEIRRELGRGAMGVVYEAYDPDLGRTIALKTLLPVPKEEREAFEQRFFAEARAARLTHPGIVVVHDVGRDPASGTLFLALEYLEGETLSEVAARGRLDWREAFRLGAQVARALHYAHAQGIVHRDMKPANVMVLPTGQTKIMDFGIAGGMVDTARFKKLTNPGEFLGTPLYTAPEQATKEKIDGRADQFSLGSILYTLIAGEPAFAADSIPDIVGRVVNDDPVPLTRIVKGLPPDADRVISRALAKDPADRYPDTRAFAEDLEDVHEGLPPRHSTEETRMLAAAAHAQPRVWGSDVELVVAEDPLETALHDLVPDAPHPEATAPTAAVPAPPVPPSRHFPWVRTMALGGGGFVLFGFLIGHFGFRGEPTPPAPVASVPETSAPVMAEAASPALAPTPTANYIAPVGPRIGPATGRLRIDFDHPLKTGTLKVWVDDDPVIEEKLGSTIEKKALVFRMRKGNFTDVLEVAPGWHEVRVEVAWEDNRKTEKIMGQFKGGVTRTLEANLGRLRKDLDLEWRK
jgi:eukaryotic-like serine/threonine-protein kinase